MMLAAPNIFICLISLAAIDKGKIFLSKWGRKYKGSSYFTMYDVCFFGSDRSPRRGDVVRASVHPFPQIMSSSSILKSPRAF